MRPLVPLPSPRRLWALALLAAAACAVAFGAPTAHADNELVSSSPADGEVIAASPTSLQLVFSQPVTGASAVEAVCNGTQAVLGAPQVGPNNTTLTVAVPTPLPRGECTIAWRVLDSDGRPETSSFSFSVQADTAAPPTSPTTTPTTGTTPATDAAAAASPTDPPRVGGPLGLARLVSTLGLATLFGGFVLIVVAWPEGVEYILTVRFMRSAWVVAVVGTLAAVVLATAQATGASVGSALSPSEWLDFADSTPGKALVARLVLAAACGWVVIRPERVIDPATQLPALAIPGLAVATMGFSRTGGDIVLIGIAAGIVHALAMAVWLGGLVLSSRVVLAGPGEHDLVQAVRGFERLSIPALILTVASGAIQTYRLDGGALFSSGHGRVLLLKAIVVGAMVFIGLATREFIRSRVARTETMSSPLAERLRRVLGVEALLGVAVLALTAWMLSLRPDNVDAGGADLGDYEIVESVVDSAFGLDVNVGISPGVVGANGVLVEVEEPDDQLSGLRLTFQPPAGANAATVFLTVGLTGDGIAVLPESEGLPLEAAGDWTLRIEATTAAGPTSAERTFTVGEPATSGSTP